VAEKSPFPKEIGQLDKKPVCLTKGKFGFYLTYNGNNYSYPKKNPTAEASEKSMENITIKEAVKLIKDRDANKLGEFEVTENNKKVKVVALKGLYGPYLSVQRGKKKTNYQIPKNINAKKLTAEIVLEIISKKKTTGSKTPKKNIPTKKTP